MALTQAMPACVCFVHPSAIGIDASRSDVSWQAYSYPASWNLADQSCQPVLMSTMQPWTPPAQYVGLGNHSCPSRQPSVQPTHYEESFQGGWTSSEESVPGDDYALLQEDYQIALQGNVWALSTDESGCRRVQAALEEAASDEDRVALVNELQPHVWEAIQCRNANFVIQKCIGTMRPAKLQFIIDAIRGSAGKVARHKYSCRILQRLVEHCPPNQLHELVEELLREAVELCTHMFGSYVMKHLLEHGANCQAAALKHILAENVSMVSEHSYGSAVLCAALEQPNQDATIALVSAFLKEPALLTRIAHSRHGQLSVKLALQVGEATLPAQRQTAISALKGARRMLSTSRYGRALNKHLAELKQ